MRRSVLPLALLLSFPTALPAAAANTVAAEAAATANAILAAAYPATEPRAAVLVKW